MTKSREDLAMVSGISALAHRLGVRIVAEGVETEEQQKLLRLLCCDEIQGLFLASPTSAEDIGKMLQ